MQKRSSLRQIVCGYPLITSCIVLYVLVALGKFVLRVTRLGGAYDIDSLFWLNGFMSDFVRRPWCFLTYMWFHNDVLHLAVNMFVLYLASKAFLTHLTKRLLLYVFVLGGVVGGMLYPLLFGLIHLMGGRSFPLPLLGSSGAVLAVAGTIVCYVSRGTRFRIGKRVYSLGQAGLLLAILAFYPILWGNWGGVIVHLGGIITGAVWGIVLRRNEQRLLAQEQADARSANEDKAKRSGYNALGEEERSKLW